MKFGLISSWHKGTEAKMDYATVNCRAETISVKNTFAVPLKKGRRCVVLAEGFYEWLKPETKEGTKQPYLVYLPQNADYFSVKNESDAERPVQLLKIAAVFDKWHVPEDGDVYSYSIVTVPASKSMSWLHDRMPAILTTDADVREWLDYENVTADQAVKLLHPTEELAWHEVTKAVGNVAYREKDAVRPIRDQKCETPKKLPKGQTSISSYFSPEKNARSPKSEHEKRKSTETKQETPSKRLRS